MQERVPRINIESDEEISRDFCYFLDNKETGNQHIIIYLCTAQSELVVCKCLSYVHLRIRNLNKAISWQDTGNFSMQEAREETERILRKARRRRRKHSNTIFISWRGIVIMLLFISFHVLGEKIIKLLGYGTTERNSIRNIVFIEVNIIFTLVTEPRSLFLTSCNWRCLTHVDDLSLLYLVQSRDIKH